MFARTTIRFVAEEEMGHRYTLHRINPRGIPFYSGNRPPECGSRQEQ